MDIDTRKALREVAAGNVEQFSIDELQGIGLTRVTSQAGRTDDDTLMQQAEQLLEAEANR